MSYENTATATGIMPSRFDYNIAIHSWVKSSYPFATEKALELLNRMVEQAQSGANLNAAPDTITYTILINAFGRNPDTQVEGLEYADYLLKYAQSGEDPNVRADATMYITYMSALHVRLTKLKRKNHAKADIASRIESILRLMREESKKVPASMVSTWHNASIYNSAISAWSKTKVPEAAERALQLYAELKRESQKEGAPSTLQPSLKLYQDLLICIGSRKNKNDRKEGLRRRVLETAEQVFREIKIRGLPLAIDTLNPYLRVLSTSGIPGAIQKAEQTLQSMEVAGGGNSQLIPDCQSYQSVMVSFTYIGPPVSMHFILYKCLPHEVGANRNIIFFQEGFAKSQPGGAENAERLLNQMIMLTGKRNLELNQACFTIVMDAWSRSGRDDAFEQAARVMQKGEELGHPPSSYSYTTLITALANCGDRIIDAPERAEALIAQMQADFVSGKNPYCKPTDAPFSPVIKCWVSSGREMAPERIDAIVLRMKELSEHHEYDGIDVNYSAFRHAILAWMKFTDRRPDAGDKALKILDIVEGHYRSGRLEASLAIHCYNATLVTIARSRDGDKAEKAYRLLKRMESLLHVRLRDYRAVLSACSETGSTKESSAHQKVSHHYLHLFSNMMGVHSLGQDGFPLLIPSYFSPKGRSFSHCQRHIPGVPGVKIRARRKHVPGIYCSSQQSFSRRRCRKEKDSVLG